MGGYVVNYVEIDFFGLVLDYWIYVFYWCIEYLVCGWCVDVEILVEGFFKGIDLCNVSEDL